MAAPFAHSPEFERLLRRDPGADLVGIALEIARDTYSELDSHHYLGVIDRLAERVRERCPSSSKLLYVLSQINWVLFVEEKYHGNTENYYDARNSYLNEVIDRKTGIPISLSVLYWAIARRLGLTLWGVNLPAHFVLRTDPSDLEMFIDPFHEGALLDRAGCERRLSQLLGRPLALSEAQFAPCGHDQVVARMLRNLKVIALREHDFMTALPVQRRLSALQPDDPVELRDLGMLCLQLDRPGEALAPLESFLGQCPDGEDAESVRALLRAARIEVARWN